MFKCPWIGIFCLLTVVISANNDFTYTGTPIPGQPFVVTWKAETYDKIDILLNNVLLNDEPIIITTSAPIATEVENTGSWVWNVPSDLQGRHSLSIATDFRHPISYSIPWINGPFTVSSITYATTIPQSTACTSTTSALPKPTSFSPFIVPDKHYYHMRAGWPTEIRWQPTTVGKVSLYAVSEESTITTKISIVKGIDNNGSYTWKPDISLSSPELPFSSYHLILSLDSDFNTNSTSPTFYVLSPDYHTDFQTNYAPAVLGEPYTIIWSPSTARTISLVLQEAVANVDKNFTIGDDIPNNGSFTWHVPSSSPDIVPGVWWLAAINSTGSWEARYELIINAEPALVCAPGSSTVDMRSSFPTVPPTTTTGTLLVNTLSVTVESHVSEASVSSPSTTSIRSVSTEIAQATTNASTSQPATVEGESNGGKNAIRFVVVLESFVVGLWTFW